MISSHFQSWMTTILAKSSSSVFCLTMVIAFCAKCLIELWAVETAGCGGVLDDATDTAAAAAMVSANKPACAGHL